MWPTGLADKNDEPAQDIVAQSSLYRNISGIYEDDGYPSAMIGVIKEEQNTSMISPGRLLNMNVRVKRIRNCAK